MTHLQYITCGKRYNLDEIIYSCKWCEDLLEVKYDYDALKAKLEKSNWKNTSLLQKPFEADAELEPIEELLGLSKSIPTLASRCSR